MLCHVTIRLLFFTSSIVVFFFFFFSSRRRHTRLQGDWSSDVCSSDLPRERHRDLDGTTEARAQPHRLRGAASRAHRGGGDLGIGDAPLDADRGAGPGPRPAPRASWHARRARAAARRARSAVGLTGMLEVITGILLAAGAVYFVLRPILHPELPESGKEGEGGLEEGEDPEDDLSPRAVALRALKEIEFDRATGKLSDADY